MKAHFLISSFEETKREINCDFADGPVHQTIEVVVRFTSSEADHIITAEEIISKISKLLEPEFNS